MSIPAFNSSMLSQDTYKNANNLTVWLFVAAVIHAIVLIGLTFTSPPAPTVGKAIEITLVNSSAKKAPENAKYFAQANQIAAGVENQKPLPLKRKKPKTGQHPKNQQKTESTLAQAPIEHRLVTRKQSEEKMLSAQKVEDNQKKDLDQKTQPEMSMEEVDKQIALLEKKLEQQKEASEKTRIKSLNQISTHRYVAAQYVKEWVDKVERTGNLNIPEINGRRDFSGNLILEVRIMYDGTLYDENPMIVKSSGISALDEAAKQIVKSMAPFAPLPKEITDELDVLSIKYEWNYFNEATTASYYNPDTESTH